MSPVTFSCCRGRPHSLYINPSLRQVNSFALACYLGYLLWTTTAFTLLHVHYHAGHLLHVQDMNTATTSATAAASTLAGLTPPPAKKACLPATQVNAASSTASSITCGQQPTEVEVISGAFKYTPKRLVRDWHFKYYCFLCDYHFCLRVVEWNCELHVKCLRCYSRNKVVFGHASREDAPHVASNCFGCYVYRLSDDHDGYESNNE